MKVRKSDSASKPGYPTRKQFFAQHKLAGAALALGALVSSSQAGNAPMPLGGVPLQEPKPAVKTQAVEEPRLPGDMAVEPRLLGKMRAPTNAPSTTTNAAPPACATTNAPPKTDPGLRLKGVMPPPRLPGKPASAP